ncbi:hypothetical protein QOZ80_4BG0329390 [Eleusine coracana subsp. coracana]|nr:hypothetical protein QOZ80_4BG0329390 [Eleusine coracana subsp. coracana]
MAMGEKKEDEEVPCYFLCPISLEMMRDPVTLPTGITYDRDCIERWLLLSCTCPVTKQAVAADCEPTPNHTLRRLIQSWCAAHHNHPPQPHQTDIDDADALALPKTKTKTKTKPTHRLVTTARVASLLSQIHHQLQLEESTYYSTSSSRRRQEEVLGELRDMAAESEWNRKLIAAVPGAVHTLITVLLVTATSSSSSSSDRDVDTDRDRDSKAAAVACDGGVDDALEILTSLQLSPECLARVLNKQEQNDHHQLLLVVEALVSALQRSTSSREHAARLLADVTAVMSPTRLASLPEQVFRVAVQLLRDNNLSNNLSTATTKACLHVLVGTTSWGRNRVKAVDAGAVAVLVDMIMLQLHQQQHDSDRPRRTRLCELAMAALDRLVMSVDVATDKAVRVLRSVAKHAATPAVVQEMAQTGVVAALCLVAHSDHQYSDRTRERAKETLRMHARAWRTSPCLHPHLQAIYPPSC